jgi:hypothetical protein
MPVWFEPKLYGYGATPVTWQSWLLIAVFVAAVIGAVWWFIGFDRSVKPEPANIVWFLATLAVLVAALWIVSQATTGGEWRWRWGETE